MEQLGLDGIEVAELEEELKLGLIQSGDRQGLEVQELCVRRMPLREDQVLERYGAAAL